MKQVQELIFSGKPLEARRRFAGLLAGEPDKLEPAAAAIVKILSSAYNHFLVRPVDAFCEDMELDLPAPVTAAIRAALDPRRERTADWRARLRGVTQERLGRECRRHVVTQDVKAAAATGLALLARGRDDAEQQEYAIFLGRALADLPNDRDRVVQALQLMLKGAGALAGPVGRVFEQFEVMSRQPASRGFDAGDQAWNRQLTEATLALREFLPNPNEVGEPSPEQVESLHEAFHAVLRAGLNGDGQAFIDALAVISEYCPAEASTIQQVAGAEDRMFVRLGPRAKLAAVRALGKLGERELLRRAIIKLAEGPDAAGRMKTICAVIGGLYHPDFLPVLARLAAHPAGELEEGWLIDALGRLAMPQAADLLEKRLADVVKKIGDRGNERRARHILAALGRIARVGRTRGLVSPEQRARIVHRAFDLVSRLERSLQFKAVEELMAGRLEELDDKLKLHAAGLCVDVMWGQPLRQPDRASNAANGWREPMVAVLKRIGAEALPTVIDAGNKHATQYGGAMAALANVLAEIGDERALPLLESMTRVAFLQSDDAPKNKLFEEKVVDAATGQLKDLDRDDLIHTLLHAIQKIGGHEGLAVLLDYADQVQAGRIASPGNLTTALLVDAKLKHGRLGEVAVRSAAPEMDEKTFKSALGDARGGLLSKKEKRITALALLGQSRNPAAVPVLLECLGDKDPMVAAAAQTALGQFMHPLPPQNEFNAFCEALLGRPALFKDKVLDQVLAFIRREMPKNPPYGTIFLRSLEVCLEDGALIHRLRAALQTAAPPTPPPGDGADPAARGEGNDSPAAPPPGRELSELDRKRAYNQARQAWIKGGKKGPEPKPPA